MKTRSSAGAPELFVIDGNPETLAASVQKPELELKTVHVCAAGVVAWLPQYCGNTGSMDKPAKGAPVTS